jgi:DNA-binding Lrp family transcriptional regulator
MLAGRKLVFACILICCEAGKFKDVAEEVKKLEGVKKAFGVHGRWDAVAEVETADIKTLGELALKINGLAEVKANETLVGF